MRRRRFLAALGGLGLAGCQGWPGLLNLCRPARLPAPLAADKRTQQVFDGLRPDYLWDGHVHLLGLGDSGPGVWINPALRKLAHPVQRAQFRFYLNASCVTQEQVKQGRADQSFLERLLALKQAFPAASRFMLLAFDYSYDETGRRRPDLSAFYVSNDYAARLHRAHPRDFEWIASIHPYREDAVEALHRAVRAGARAVKWLPPAMGIDPSDKLCDPFYEALAQADIPLLIHTGDEHAVQGSDQQDFGNPLLLRRPLEHGARVVAAHCASLGKGRDLDRGPSGPLIDNFSLFERLMKDPRHEGRLFGEISAVTQRNRDGRVLKTLLETDEWHDRLVNGSDYPLPGVLPVFSLRKLVREQFIDAATASVLTEIRRHNPILFDFMLKRLARSGTKGFSPRVFESRRVYGRPVGLPIGETES